MILPVRRLAARGIGDEDVDDHWNGRWVTLRTVDMHGKSNWLEKCEGIPGSYSLVTPDMTRVPVFATAAECS